MNTCSLLFIALFVLKLLGRIDWSWVWVFSPLWLCVIFWTIALFVVSWFKARQEQEAEERRHSSHAG